MSLQKPLGSSSRRGGNDDGAAHPRSGCSHSWGLEPPLGDGEGPVRLHHTRHAAGDWGDLCPFDRRQNEIALREGLRIFSSYETPAGCCWIITEADRSVTTILLPEEY